MLGHIYLMRRKKHSLSTQKAFQAFLELFLKFLLLFAVMDNM